MAMPWHSTSCTDRHTLHGRLTPRLAACAWQRLESGGYNKNELALGANGLGCRLSRQTPVYDTSVGLRPL